MHLSNSSCFPFVQAEILPRGTTVEYTHVIEYGVKVGCFYTMIFRGCTDQSRLEATANDYASKLIALFKQKRISIDSHRIEYCGRKINIYFTKENFRGDGYLPEITAAFAQQIRNERCASIVKRCDPVRHARILQSLVATQVNVKPA